jgi:two-component system, OmpR family, sensor histidine kinase KdpD
MFEDLSRRIDDGRPSPEEMLERVRRQAGAGARGRLRIFLGMAPGVGKTFAMLQEGHRRKDRGTDVVIGFVETYGRPHTIEAIGDLEIVPRKPVSYKGVTLEEMDVDAVICRAPAVALVDELAHTNAPGSRREKRWQDVEDLLERGITVITTMNVQHLESVADIVESITGVKVRERIPDQVVDQADEVELVDMSPHALRQRIRHGNVYPPERSEQALSNFFREGNLAALREMALRKVSATVEDDLEQYMRAQQVEAVWPAGERVMVCVGPKPSDERLVRRAWRLADRLHSDLIAVFVETAAWASASPESKRSLEANLRLAEDLGATIVRVDGRDVGAELARVAHEQNVGHVFIGQTHRGRMWQILHGSAVARLLQLAPDLDVTVVAERPRK